jgi:flagellar biosynthesis chaperone FliJ
MSGIKSKRWYENQIKALENAAKRTGQLIESCDWTTDPIKMSEIGKRNSPIQKQCKIIYEQLNQLKDEYYLYYK